MPKCEKCDEDMKLIDRYDVSIGSTDIQTLRERCTSCGYIRRIQYYDNRRIG